MQITGIKTHKITKNDTLFQVLDQYVKPVISTSLRGEISEEPRSLTKTNLVRDDKLVLAIASKIVAITEGRTVPLQSADKDTLVQQESQYYLPGNTNKYQVSFTITHDMLVPTAGIDESNANGTYVLWPEDPQASANAIRQHIVEKFGIKEVGVIITDSRTVPLRWGVTAMAIAYSGFEPLKDYIGTPDIYGRTFAFEKLNIADSLAAAAGLAMGEGNEQIPLAVITDIPHIIFQQRNPTQEELASLVINKEDDLYAPFLTSVKWEKGEK